MSVASEEAVLLFVARTKGAVGYVDGTNADPLPAGVGKMFCLPPTSGPAPPSSDGP